MIGYLALVTLLATCAVNHVASAQASASTEQPPQVFVDTSGSRYHTCAIDAGGSLTCTQSSFAYRLAPPADLPALTDVVAGNVHACGLTQSGTAVCWGDNDFGQLDAPEGVQFTTIAAGRSHSCGMTPGGSVQCWGLNDVDQSEPPDGSQLDPDSQQPVTFVALALATRHSCALDSVGQVHCWGDVEQAYRSASLADAAAGSTVVKLAIDRDYPVDFQCGLLSDGRIECVNERGLFYMQYVDIAGADGLICGLTQTGYLHCRSRSASDYDPFIQSQISAINDGEPLVSIHSGARLCGITASGRIKCIDKWSTTMPLPGEALSAVQAPRDLRASVYSDTTAELFWQRHDRDAWEIAQVEIYRDDELLAQTDHYDSYLDDSREPGRDYTYRVRYLPVVGAPGEFSRPLVVNASSGGSQESDYTPVARPDEVQNLQALVYGPRLLELLWTRPSANGLGYEIRRNGEFKAYVLGSSYLDRSVSPGNDYVYEVITVDDAGQILGVAMTQAEVN